MTPDQIAYLATCGLMFLAGVIVLTVGVAGANIAERRSGYSSDNWGLVIGLGLLCMTVGPFMLIGFPA